MPQRCTPCHVAIDEDGLGWHFTVETVRTEMMVHADARRFGSRKAARDAADVWMEGHRRFYCERSVMADLPHAAQGQAESR